MSVCKLYLSGDPEPMFVDLAADIVIGLVAEAVSEDFMALPITGLGGPARSAYIRAGRVSAVMPLTEPERDALAEGFELENE